jgi:hypothetical protein
MERLPGPREKTVVEKKREFCKGQCRERRWEKKEEKGRRRRRKRAIRLLSTARDEVQHNILHTADGPRRAGWLKGSPTQHCMQSRLLLYAGVMLDQGQGGGD